MNRNKKYIFLIPAFVFATVIYYAQNKPVTEKKETKYIEVKKASKFIYDKKLGAQRLLGGVNCEHEGVIMNCDSAWLFDNNTLEAYGHINIRQGDSLFITGEKLKYDGSTKIAALEGNVTCIEKDMNLTTNVLTYDVPAATASYFGGGTVQSKNNTLTSKNGYYHSPSKTLSFRYDVKLKNPEYTMECDTLQYNTVSRTAYFTGPSTIYGDSTTIKTEAGWYSTIKENCKLTKNSEIKSGKQILKGDSIFYERKRGYGLVLGNVLITDTTGESAINGQKAEYWEDAGLSIVSGRPVMTQFFKEDTLFIGADTLYSWFNNKNGERILRAYHNSIIYKSDLQGKCDSIEYKTEDSVMVMYRHPLLWSGESQLSAKQISIKTGNKKIYGFTLQDEAFVTQQKDSLFFDQISGRSIEGFCTDNKITDIHVKGNAQAIYFLEEKKKVMGMNKTDCSEMRIKTGKDGIEKISFIKKPVSSILPLKDVSNDQLLLKGFRWDEAQRPLSAKDVIK